MIKGTVVQLKDLVDLDLGTRKMRYAARDAILYALAVGAPASQLDLVYERDLRVLPTYACALGLWAVEKAGSLGAYDRKRSLHASQSLTMHEVMPREGEIDMRGKVEAVWDKGKASIVEIAVEFKIFSAVYTIFLPGIGNWGGTSGPSNTQSGPVEGGESWQASFQTSTYLAALYRLTGDLHPIHIDPEIARANGFDRPILHGLCTLGIVARMSAEAAGSHPCNLKTIKSRLSAPVMPGETIALTAQLSGNALSFEANVEGRAVLRGGYAVFGS